MICKWCWVNIKPCPSTRGYKDAAGSLWCRVSSVGHAHRPRLPSLEEAIGGLLMIEEDLR